MCDLGHLGPSRVKVYLVTLGTTLFMTLQRPGDKPAYSKPDISECFPRLRNVCRTAYHCPVFFYFM